MKLVTLRDETVGQITETMHDSELYLSARSLFEFPEEFDLSPMSVHRFNLPVISYGFFGKKYSDLIISFRDFMGPSALHRIFGYPNLQKETNFKINYIVLSPALQPIKGFQFEIERIKSVSFDTSVLIVADIHFKVKSMKYVDYKVEDSIDKFPN